MYPSLILSLSILPILGLAVPTAITGDNNVATTPSVQQRSTAAVITKQDSSASNSTRTDATVNYFPDPVVHCSGRYLDDEGDDDWSTDLNTAVTTSSSAGLYGSCDVDGDDVDGDGSLAFKSGTVQVYYCNHAFAAQTCSLNEYWRADALITAQCGSSGGGWVTISDWSKTIGRDPTNSDGSFRSECGDSLHGADANFVIVNATLTR